VQQIKTQVKQPDAQPNPVGESTDKQFTKKVEYQKYLKQLQDDAEQDQFRIEAIYRVFYSTKRNSCLCAKYMLYPAKQGEGSEDVEIIDILNQEQVWYTHYPVAKKYWDATADLDEHIKQLE
jgi:hypothetical protein